MGQSIAVMNTKGGVGKSTVTMALAETLAAFHGKNVLVIDSDSQTSISIMLTSMQRWEAAEADQRTLVEYLTTTVLTDGETDWKQHVMPGVCDVDDADTIYLLPGHMNLTLFEREVSVEQRHGELRQTVRALLDDAENYFDVILIDCPPGLSVLTECWLREADYYLPPTKADYLSVRGLAILQKFRQSSSQHGFADLLGVLINQKDEQSPSEVAWHRRLISAKQNRCFPVGIPRRTYIQRAADFDPSTRSYMAKYPGDAGIAIRAVTEAVVTRMQHVAALKRQIGNDPAALESAIDNVIASPDDGLPLQPDPQIDETPGNVVPQPVAETTPTGEEIIDLESAAVPADTNGAGASEDKSPPQVTETAATEKGPMEAEMGAPQETEIVDLAAPVGRESDGAGDPVPPASGSETASAPQEDARTIH